MSDIVLIEFNELAMPLLARFIAAGDLPNFKRFYDSSTIYKTSAGEDPLEPWVQWPSVHCGVPYAQHRALHLGDGRRVTQKGLGTILSDFGIRVGIFGVMNSNYTRPNGYHIPDFWDEREWVHPQELLPFWDFLAHHVKESTRELGLGLVPALKFVRFMFTHGLTGPTALAVIRQLLAECFKPQLRWKRAIVLDSLQYDVFRHLNKKYAVRFASFFSNSTAHLQHYFWRNMDPRGFGVAPDPKADPSLRTAIRFGYRSMDRLLGRIMADYPDRRLIICTGLSQEPWFETTKCTYRPMSFEGFLRFANISKRVRVVPAMAERFRLECKDEAHARAVKTALDRLTFRGGQLMDSSYFGNSVYTGCGVMDADSEISDEQVYCGDDVERFGELFYRITAMNSGRHHHEGSLWIRNGIHRVVDDHIPLGAIAPTILAHFGIEAPQTMRSELVLADGHTDALIFR